jgi:SAM-dependent methyltransferase
LPNSSNYLYITKKNFMLKILPNKIVRLYKLIKELAQLKDMLEKNMAQNAYDSLEIKSFISGISEDIAKVRILHEQINLNESKYQKATPKAFESYERELEELDPKIYPIYKTLFENGKRAYESTVVGNFSNWDDIYSNLFSKFVFKYIYGRVLDIGCGTNYKPIYLSGYPDSLISAIEPLPLNYNPDFEIIRGFTEFLPWPENSFSTITAATSLDHVISLEVSFNQIKRVLLPNGLFLLWISNIPNAKPFTPEAENFKAEDEFHLFHFDWKWLEPLLTTHGFQIVDKVTIPRPGFDHIFYCLQLKK